MGLDVFLRFLVAEVFLGVWRVLHLLQGMLFVFAGDTVDVVIVDAQLGL